MGIGAGIFLIAIGAVLTWAVDWHVAGINIHVIGWILMVCGLLGIIVTMVVWSNRRAASGRVVERQTDYPPGGGTGYPAGPTSRTTERVYEDPPL